MQHFTLPATTLLVGLFLGFLAGRHVLPPGEEAGPGRKAGIVIDTAREYRVARVADGDTIVLENGLHVRYASVDARENYFFIRRPEPFAQEATLENRRLVSGKTVRLRLGKRMFDRYGRLLAEVVLVGGAEAEASPSERLLKAGLARCQWEFLRELPPERARRYRAIESRAKARRRGIWSARQPELGEAPPGAVLVASARGKVFHLRSCPYAAKIAPENREFFPDRASAAAEGLRPCRHCRPDEREETEESAPQ